MSVSTSEFPCLKNTAIWDSGSTLCCCSVAIKSCLTLQPHGLQHARLPCPSPSPRVCSNSCLLSRWYYLTIASSDALFSSHLQSFSVSGSFPVSRLFPSGGQSIGASASASVLPMNVQGWFSLGLTVLISLSSKSNIFMYKYITSSQIFLFIL